MSVATKSPAVVALEPFAVTPAMELVEVFDCLEASSSSLKCTFVAVFGFTGKSSPGGGLAAVTAPTAVLG